jgi:hypothetical protein
VILGVVLPKEFSRVLTTPYPQVEGTSSSSVRISQELVTMIRALWDAEILAVGNIPVCLSSYASVLEKEVTS